MALLAVAGCTPRFRHDSLSANGSNRMTPMSKELWDAVKPLLEEALELEPDARAAWLNSLRERSTALADEVSALLDQELGEVDQLFTPARGADTLGQSLAGLVVAGYTLDR